MLCLTNILKINYLQIYNKIGEIGRVKVFYFINIKKITAVSADQVFLYLEIQQILQQILYHTVLELIFLKKNKKKNMH